MRPDEYNENEDDDGDYDDDEEEGSSYEGEYSEEDIGDLDDEPIVVEPIVPVPRTFEEMQNMYQPKNNKNFEPEPLRQEKASVTFAARDEIKTIEEPIVETVKAIEEDPIASLVTDDGKEVHEDSASADSDEDENVDQSQEDVDEDDSEAAEDEEEEELEDDDDVDEEHGSEEELSDVDDTDLMKRLESKYGKLPDTNDSDDGGVADDKSWTSNATSK